MSERLFVIMEIKEADPGLGPLVSGRKKYLPAFFNPSEGADEQLFLYPTSVIPASRLGYCHPGKTERWFSPIMGWTHATCRHGEVLVWFREKEQEKSSLNQWLDNAPASVPEDIKKMLRAYFKED